MDMFRKLFRHRHSDKPAFLKVGTNVPPPMWCKCGTEAKWPNYEWYMPKRYTADELEQLAIQRQELREKLDKRSRRWR